jgi:hypothetical protein
MAPPGRRGEWQLLALRVRSIVFTAQFFIVRFATDSLLEGSGFEPSVPHQKDNAFEASPAPASRFVADRCKEGPLGRRSKAASCSPRR